MDPLAQVRAIAERVAGSAGLEIFDVQFRRESGGWVLRVVIDRPWRGAADGTPEGTDEAIGVDDCQRFSGDMSAVLDVEEVIDRQYTLEVSSPGLDRPLRHLDDYRRFRGRMVKLVTGEPVDNQTFFEGRLEGVDREQVLVSVGKKGRVCRVPLALVTRARLEVEF